MKEYMKVGSASDGGIGFSVRHSNEQVRIGTRAINSHDELVEMNKELMELLVEAERYVRYRLEYTECDARIVMWLIANIEEATSKAKGGAA